MAASKKKQISAFEGMSSYIDEIRQIAYAPQDEEWEKKCLHILNGGAAKELRRKVSLATRREYGAFFTGGKLATELAALLPEHQNTNVYYDPTCGMGDLLLAVANNLPLKKTLGDTLKSWGKRLSGNDLHSEFVEGTKLRLIILARLRQGAKRHISGVKREYFPHIQVANGLAANDLVQRATHILLNPPFGTVPAPDSCTWASGKITEAALFLASILERASPRSQVLSILPDVLRSGSFSTQWRNTISNLAEVHLVRPYGIFDESADVDVFLAKFVRRPVISLSSSPAVELRWPDIAPSAKSVLSSYFDVHVGRVVPHRDKLEGPTYSYIHARSIQPWTTMSRFEETIRHLGKPYDPPFVVIRRTSRPEQEHRAVATIIAGTQPVAVENHLIVCAPKDKELSTCKQLALQLKREATDEYLNVRIRCRHLTVAAVREIPFEKATK